MNPPFVIEPLADHDLEAFSSNLAKSDTWLKTSAKAEQAQGRTACFVAVDRISAHVSGFYAIGLRLVHLQGLYQYRQDMVETYPYVRVAWLGHLGLDRRTGSAELGGALLANALHRAAPRGQHSM